MKTKGIFTNWRQPKTFNCICLADGEPRPIALIPDLYTLARLAYIKEIEQFDTPTHRESMRLMKTYYDQMARYNITIIRPKMTEGIERAQYYFECLGKRYNIKLLLKWWEKHIDSIPF